MIFAKSILQGVSREQYPEIYRGIDGLLKLKDFPDDSLLHLIPGSTDMLELKLTDKGHAERVLLQEETFVAVQDAAFELLRRFNS